MATLKQHPQENISSVSSIHKNSNKTIFSNVSANNTNRTIGNSQDTDLNRNVQEAAKTSRVSPNAPNKIEKNTLKQTIPKLLCLKKSSSTLDERNFKTLNVSTLGAENLSWNDYYNINGNVTKHLDNFRSNRTADCSEREEGPPSSSKHHECLLNPNTNRKSFHQNVEDALSSLLWQPYEYQTKTSATSMSSRFVLSLFNATILTV